ncbi:MAG: YkvA family protein [Xenophilus sp.]
MWKLGRLWMLMRKELTLVWVMLRDPRSPIAAKLTALAAVLYVLSPVDLVPDVIPVLGWLDDGVVALLLMKLATHFLPADLRASLTAQVQRRAAATARR